MHSYRSLAASLIAALALAAACNPRDTSTPASNATAQNATAHNATKTAATTTPEPTDDVRRITREELQAELEKNSVALFDVRDKVSYEAGHIKGAKLVPWSEVETRLNEFPKGELIVTYCA